MGRPTSDHYHTQPGFHDRITFNVAVAHPQVVSEGYPSTLSNDWDPAHIVGPVGEMIGEDFYL